MIYALHEALAVIVDEGLENVIQRHLKHGNALKAGLEAMGLTLHAQKGHRLSMLTSVRIPSGIDDLKIKKGLLNEFGIEIGGLNRALLEWEKVYNTIRPNQALGYLTPLEFLKQYQQKRRKVMCH